MQSKPGPILAVVAGTVTCTAVGSVISILACDFSPNPDIKCCVNGNLQDLGQSAAAQRIKLMVAQHHFAVQGFLYLTADWERIPIMMDRYTSLLALPSLALSWNFAPADRAPESTVLKCRNGLQVLHLERPGNATTVDIWVRAGSKFEPVPGAGVAHFLEHMLFHGSDRLQSGDFDRLIESVGGTIQAVTSHDYAHYSTTLATKHAPQAIASLLDILCNATIPDSLFDCERSIIQAELHQAYCDPDWQAQTALLSQLYPAHAYGWPVLGETSQVAQLTPLHLRDYHRQHYQPQRMTVMVVGSLTLSATQDAIQQLTPVSRSFNPFRRPQFPAVPLPPPANFPHKVLHLPNLHQPQLLMAWPTPGARAIASGYALDLLCHLLTETPSAYLVQELCHRRGWVTDIRSQFLCQTEGGTLILSMQMSDDFSEAVRDLVWTYFKLLETHAFPDELIHRAQRRLRNDFIFAQETSTDLASLYGYYSVLDQLDWALAYPTVLAQISAAHLQNLILQFLQPPTCSSLLLLPR